MVSFCSVLPGDRCVFTAAAWPFYYFAQTPQDPMQTARPIRCTIHWSGNDDYKPCDLWCKLAWTSQHACCEKWLSSYITHISLQRRFAKLNSQFRRVATRTRNQPNTNHLIRRTKRWIDAEYNKQQIYRCTFNRYMALFLIKAMNPCHARTPPRYINGIYNRSQIPIKCERRSGK